MYKIFSFLYAIASILCFNTICYSHSCGTTTINGSTRSIPYSQTCTNLSFQVPHLKGTVHYVLSAIPYNPFPFTVSTGGTEDANLYADDQNNNTFNLLFPFCFYDSTYTKAVIGSNSLWGFDGTNGVFGCDIAYTITPSIPSTVSGAKRFKILEITIPFLKKKWLNEL